MQLKKTIQKTESIEVDVTLPYFSKNNVYNYALISEKELWVVEKESALGECLVNKRNVFDLAHVFAQEESNQDEFWKAYSCAMEKLSGFPIEQPLFKEPVKSEENESAN